MKSRAAVAWEARKPLTVETIEINTAFSLMHAGKSIRSVVLF